MKATVIVPVNVKPMSGNMTPVKLPAGYCFYGEVSTGGTDIIKFDHYYTDKGMRVELGQMCKASIGQNLKLNLEDEPGNPPVVTFGAPDEIQARWETGKDTTGNPVYSEWFTYDLRK